MSNPPTSPAFVIDQQVLQESVELLNELRQRSGCRVLYSIKALPFESVLKWLKPHVDGFSVSSLFEAQWAYEVLDKEQSIHLTTPGIRPDEMTQLSQICSHISFNSLNQRQAFCRTEHEAVSMGLRVNPKLSFLSDERFDPCRLHSKLGVDMHTIAAQDIVGLSGLHMHTVFSQCDYVPLLQTLDKLQQQLGEYFKQLQWLNLGGGYLFKDINDHQAFIQLIRILRRKYALDVYIEPGKAVVGDALSLMATVIDCFVSDGKTIAVLDTSINHNPEVFEYQRQPEILQSDALGHYQAILVGSTCLAGDVFGEYTFMRAVKIGDIITFPKVGAYTLVKANRFNGYNYPTIYSLDAGTLKCLKRYDYADYRKHWLAD
ncbi:MAG: carboxynorspermidine decarboxylase [Methylococcaceae bacterium]|nr:carboxynorspermidine decarboxylase [Methylococcaceae bacterium]